MSIEWCSHFRAISTLILKLFASLARFLGLFTLGGRDRRCHRPPVLLQRRFPRQRRHLLLLLQYGGRGSGGQRRQEWLAVAAEVFQHRDFAAGLRRLKLVVVRDEGHIVGAVVVVVTVENVGRRQGGFERRWQGGNFIPLFRYRLLSGKGGNA